MLVCCQPERFKRMIHALRKPGVVIVSGFDGTLATDDVSSFGVIERYEHMSDTFRESVRRIRMEVQDSIDDLESRPHTPNERNRVMLDWYARTIDLFSQGEITSLIVDDAVRSQSMRFRYGMQCLIHMCENLDIPLVVYSCGIDNVIRRSICAFDGTHNMSIVANQMYFDTDGRNGQFYNAFLPTDKCGQHLKERLLQSKSIFFNRGTVLILGSSAHDAAMVDGIDLESFGIEVNVFKIGFCSTPTREMTLAYDALVLNDSLEWITLLLERA
jgi:2-hydroxy-3-keto-5-methylthiopentenyl-1-phosphate phosphatase